MFPAFSSREVALGQMRKIGIHFIIYLNSLWQCYLTFLSVLFTPAIDCWIPIHPIVNVWLMGQNSWYIECPWLNHGICSTSSAICFSLCSKLATIFKYGLITDSTSQNVFLSFHQHMCNLKRGKEKRIFTGRFIYDCSMEGILLFAWMFVLLLENLRGLVLMLCFPL